MIDRNDGLPVSRQAKVLGISRGSVYYLPRMASADNLAVPGVGEEDRLFAELISKNAADLDALGRPPPLWLGGGRPRYRSTPDRSDR